MYYRGTGLHHLHYRKESKVSTPLSFSPPPPDHHITDIMTTYFFHFSPPPTEVFFLPFPKRVSWRERKGREEREKEVEDNGDDSVESDVQFDNVVLKLKKKGFSN
jgi:hypothetical protein